MYVYDANRGHIIYPICIYLDFTFYKIKYYYCNWIKLNVCMFMMQTRAILLYPIIRIYICRFYILRNQPDTYERVYILYVCVWNVFVRERSNNNIRKWRGCHPQPNIHCNLCRIYTGCIKCLVYTGFCMNITAMSW